MKDLSYPPSISKVSLPQSLKIELEIDHFQRDYDGLRKHKQRKHLR